MGLCSNDSSDSARFALHIKAALLRSDRIVRAYLVQDFLLISCEVLALSELEAKLLAQIVHIAVFHCFCALSESG
jgi:hypothetical protein